MSPKNDRDKLGQIYLPPLEKRMVVDHLEDVLKRYYYSTYKVVASKKVENTPISLKRLNDNLILTIDKPN